MPEEETHRSIADASKPNAGRIYDFVLGGSHNFEVDRTAAEQVLQLAPTFPKVARTVRWFLGEAVRRLAADGFTNFIDFASGLPTVDHIHQVAPAGTKVIYSDIDPVTVAYGQEIIKDNPNVRYLVCSAEKPEDLLNSPMVSELFGTNRRVGVGFNGIAWFVADDSIRRSMRVLYDWAANGSRLFLCDTGFQGGTLPAAALETTKVYEKIGQPMTIRNFGYTQGIDTALESEGTRIHASRTVVWHEGSACGRNPENGRSDGNFSRRDT